MYTIAVVDDERQQVDVISGYLERYFGGDSAKDKEYSVVTFSDGKELLDGYEPKYDIIFLDIQMNEVDGMNAARAVREIDEHTAIIFVTRLAGYAIKGYEVSAFDFIVKPLDYQAFSMKLARALKYVDANREKNIRVDIGAGETRWVAASQVRYIETQNHNLILHLVGEDLKIWSSLKNIAEQFAGEGFEFCNRCYLVNLRYVTGINKNLCMLGSESILISRYKRDGFVAALARFYGQGHGGGGT